MAELAHEERRLKAQSLERSIEQRSGAGARFARFHASIRDPRQIEFTSSMIVMPPDHAPTGGWDLRPFVISLGILAVATILYALDDSSILTLGPAREFLGRGSPATSRLLPAPAVGSQPLTQTGGAGLPSVPAEAVAEEARAAGMAHPTESGWSVALQGIFGQREAPRGNGATGSFKTNRLGPVYRGAADEKSIFALPEDFGRRLPNTRESHGEEPGTGGPSAREIDDQGNTSSKLDEVEPGNITEAMPIEIDNPAVFEPLVRIATLRHKENVPAVLAAFDRSLGQNPRFYTPRIEIGGSAFHTVYVGPFESARAAAAMCEKMRAHGGDCSLAAR
jgi:hypothetical protein